MRRTPTILIGTCFALVSTSALGQEFCSDVLRYAAYNYSSDAIRYSEIKSAYDQYCDGSQARSSKNLDIGLSVIVQAVPIGFSLGSGSSEEKVTTFCRVTKSDIETNFQRYQSSQLVSPEAMKAYETCLSLYEKGMDFKPTILQDQVLVDIRKRGADVEQVLGISADSDKLACTVPNDDSQPNSPQALRASLSTRKSLKDGNFWSVTCRRAPSKQGNLTVYPPATISITTSRGSFGLSVPPDSQLPVQSAQAIQDSLTRMNSELEQLKRPKKLACKVNSSDSGRGRYPSATANLKDQDKGDAAWQVVGGGCEQIGQPNNFAFIKGIPNGSPIATGWLCQTGDIPGAPADLQVRAYVVYCRSDQME